MLSKKWEVIMIDLTSELKEIYNLSAKMEYVWHEMECRLILKILCGKSFHFKSRTSQME